MEIRRRFVFEEVVENADDKVLARLKFVDRSGFVEKWVPLDQVSGLEPGARIELIEDVDAGMSPHIIRVDFRRTADRLRGGPDAPGGARAVRPRCQPLEHGDLGGDRRTPS